MKHTESLDIARLRGATLIKLILLGSTLGGALVTSVFGVAALFGVEILQWNSQYVTGLTGLVASPFIGAFIGIIFGLITTLFTYVGLRAFSRFRGMTLEYVPVNGPVLPHAEDKAE